MFPLIHNNASIRYCAWLIAGWLTIASVQAESSKESLQKLQDRIASLKAKLDRTEGAHTEASDALKKSEKAISKANRKIYQLTQQEKTIATELETIRQNRSTLSATITHQQTLLVNQLYLQYLNGEQSYLRALLQQHDPSIIARDLSYFSYVAKARAKLIGDLQKNLAQAAKLDSQTETALKKIANLKENQLKESQELKKQKSKRRNVLKKLAKQLQTQRGQISRMQRDEKRLSRLVEQLATIVPEVPTEKTVLQKPKPDKDSLLNENLPTAKLDTRVFASLKGKLHLPVRGELTNRFGAARAGGGVSWKGLFIKAKEGSIVRVVASGRVVFADWLRGFGNLMIVDHGSGYMSLYGNNQTLLKQVGDNVKAGDNIAAVGNSGGNKDAGVYFELRKKSKPFDPLAWCRLN